MTILGYHKTATTTFLGVGTAKIERAAVCLEYTAEQQMRIARDFARLLGPGGTLSLHDTQYRSCVANDGMPFELSVAWGKLESQLRFLVEPLSEGGIPSDGVTASALSALAGRTGVSLSRYAKIASIFSGTGRSTFSTWISGAYGKNSDALYKVYLNPGQYIEESWNTVTEAMHTLGLSAAWERTKACYMHTSCRPTYFSIDLSSAMSARIKVYMKHESTNGLEEILDLSPAHRSLAEACRGLANDWGTSKKFLQTCVTFRADRAESAGLTLYYPLSPNLPSDAVAMRRVARLLRGERLDADGYLAVSRALAAGPPGETSTQSWLGIKKIPGTTVTVYFGPETLRSQTTSSS